MGKKSRKRRGRRSAQADIPFRAPPPPPGSGYEDPHPAFADFTGIPSIKVDLEVVRLLLGFQPAGRTMEQETVGFVDLVDGNEDLREYWKRASQHDKQEVLAVEADAVYNILNTLRKLKVRYKQIHPESIKAIQAKFLLAMERQTGEMEPQPPPETEEGSANGVYVNLIDPTVEELAAIYILKENLALRYTQDLIHRDFASVIIYAAWASMSTWYYGLAAMFLVTYGIGSSLTFIAICRLAFKEFINSAFASKKDASFAFDDDIRYRILRRICVLIAAPYVFGFLEDNVFIGMTDEKNFGRLRQVLSWLNKGLLVFFAYTSYASSILVASLFFHNLTYSLLSLVVSVAASAVLRVASFVFGFISDYKRVAMFRWIEAHAKVVTVAVFVMNVVAIYYSWDWSTMWGGIFRVTFAGLTILTVPLNHISKIIEVFSAVIFLPFAALDTALKAVLVRLGLEDDLDQSGPFKSPRESFFEESRRRKAEGY